MLGTRWVSGSWHSPVVPSSAGPGRVEVAERDRPQAVGPFVIPQDVLDHELGPAVGIGRPGRVVLGDGRFQGLAVDRRRRGEDQGVRPGLQHGVEEVEAGGEVVGVVLAGIGVGLADLDEGREVEDGSDLVLAEDPAQGVPVEEVGPDERHGADELGPAAREVIEDQDVEPLPDELPDRMGPDVAGAAGDEDGHGPVLSMRRRAFSRPPALVSKPLSSWAL